jgi:hypothetical protein
VSLFISAREDARVEYFWPSFLKRRTSEGGTNCDLRIGGGGTEVKQI